MLKKQQLQAITLLKSGLNQVETAQHLGITVRTLQRWQLQDDYQKAFNAVGEVSETQTTATSQAISQAAEIVNTRDKYRQHELDLLNNLEIGLNAMLENEPHNLRAYDRLIKISERRAKLLGLDIRNYALMEAVEMLTAEGIVTDNHAAIIRDGIENIRQGLVINGYRHSPDFDADADPQIV
jgi:hypothetical protein